MSKNVYDLSLQNQSSENRKILISDSKKKYDLSFTPAMVNRIYYPRWVSNQTEFIGMIGTYNTIQKKQDNGEDITTEDLEKLNKFIELSKESAQVGIDLIIYTMKANGYEDFTEDELLNNFSQAGINDVINFIIGIDKKKQK